MNRSISETAGGTSPLVKRPRLLLGLAAFVAVLLAAPAVSGAPISPEATKSAGDGAAWLATQLDAQIPLELFGSPDWGVTLDAASALASLDATNPLIEEVWTAVVANRDAIVAKDGADIPGNLAKVILLAHSIGEDPSTVGSGTGSDLVQRLADTLQPSGLYGSQSPNYDGVYRQGLTLAALSSSGRTADPTAIQWLSDQQCTNVGFEGAFMSYRADTSIDCFDDPGNWVGADSNAAALAITGLTNAAKGETEPDGAVERALAWLAGTQASGGGWASNSWSDQDPNSTAVVIQALITRGALGEPRFNDKTASPADALMSFQIGADGAEADRGAFEFPAAGPGPNLLASVQAVPATAGQPLVFVGPKPEQPSTTTTTTTTAPGAVTTTTLPTTNLPTTNVPSTNVPSSAGNGSPGAGSYRPSNGTPVSSAAGRPISFAG